MFLIIRFGKLAFIYSGLDRLREDKPLILKTFMVNLRNFKVVFSIILLLDLSRPIQEEYFRLYSTIGNTLLGNFYIPSVQNES